MEPNANVILRTLPVKIDGSDLSDQNKWINKPIHLLR